jgi:hypothetical protein
VRQPLLDSILPGHPDRMQTGRSERLQQRLQLLQQRVRCVGGDSDRRRDPKSDGLREPVL